MTSIKKFVKEHKGNIVKGVVLAGVCCGAAYVGCTLAIQTTNFNVTLCNTAGDLLGKLDG